MEKLLALAMLSTVSLTEPCFGVDFIRDRVYASFSTDSVAVGYHCTESIKISVEPMIFFSNIIDYGELSYALQQLQKQELSLQAKEQVQKSFVFVIQENPEFKKQDLEQIKQQLQLQKRALEQQLSDSSSKDMWGILVKLHYHYKFTKTDIIPYASIGMGASVNGKTEYGFSYKINFGANLPLFSRINVFASYRLLGVREDYAHGREFGINFNF